MILQLSSSPETDHIPIDVTSPVKKQQTAKISTSGIGVLHSYCRQRRSIGSFSATAGLLGLCLSMVARPIDKQELFIIFIPWRISKVCHIIIIIIFILLL